MSTIKVEPLHKDFGAKIRGVDLGVLPNEAQIADIKTAIDAHSLLVFPEQKLNDDTQLAFTRRLGEPEVNHLRLGRDGVSDYFGTVGNVQQDGTVLGNDHKHTKFAMGNNMWHTDASFRQVPTFVSMNYVYEVPDEGGQTQYVSARGAYRRLPNEVKQTIDPLVGIHDYVFSRSKVAKVEPSHAASLPPVKQKLVRQNPSTGEKNYFVGAHAKTIVGWGHTEARQLLDDLLDRATTPEYVYTHNWEPGQLVLWDNRCLLHKGTGYDADKCRRYMRQTRVVGAGPTLEE